MNPELVRLAGRLAELGEQQITVGNRSGDEVSEHAARATDLPGLLGDVERRGDGWWVAGCRLGVLVVRSGSRWVATDDRAAALLDLPAAADG